VLRSCGMKALDTVFAATRVVLSLVFPFRCVLCDEKVPAASAWSLCADCASALLDTADRALLLERCSSCGKPIISENGRCMRCRTTEYSFNSVYPLFRYDGDARSLILAYKSRKRRSLAGFLALLVAKSLENRFPGRLIVPVPPRRGKQRRKGWDQVEDIVRVLEQRHGIAVSRILARGDGREQKSLNLHDRRLNIKGTIKLLAGSCVPDQVVLLDDILTTGATLSECAAVLKAAGASQVDACVLAAD